MTRKKSIVQTTNAGIYPRMHARSKNIAARHSYAWYIFLYTFDPPFLLIYSSIPVLYTCSPALLFLVFVSDERKVTPLHLILQELVDSKGDSLTGSDTHDSGCDTLVESMESFLPRNCQNK